MKDKNVLIAVVLVVISIIAVSLTTTFIVGREKVLCRHIVLTQYATYKDAGYECKLIHMKNIDPTKADGFKYHIALQVKIDNKWMWVEQPEMHFTVTDKQPPNTKLLKEMSFQEVVNWVDKPKGN